MGRRTCSNAGRDLLRAAFLLGSISWPLITGKTFNLSLFMGLIMVIAEESMIRAGERRLRAIMMTALATIAGMVPQALAWGAGSQMLQPLAIAAIGGIIASMALSLLVTPAVHYYSGGRE